MTALLAAEWRKAATTKLPWLLAFLAVAYSALQAVMLVLLAAPGLMEGFTGETGGGNMLLSPDYLGSTLGQVATAATFALLLGIIAVTGEYRHMTITSTYLVTPHRSRVLFAKLLVYGALGAALAVVTLVVVTLAMLVALLPFDHAPLTISMWLTVLLGAVIGMGLFGMLGVSLGALIPNQVAAIVTALLWMLLLEPLIGLAFPKVAMWLPGGALNAAMDIGLRAEATGQFVATDHLPVWGGIGLLLAYTAAFALIGSRTTLRRDIT